MAHSTLGKSQHAPRSRLSILADLEFEARLILAWLWAPLKSRLGSMLRFGPRSNITTTIRDRSPGQSGGVKPTSSLAPAAIYSARRGPKRFLAARHGGE